MDNRDFKIFTLRCFGILSVGCLSYERHKGTSGEEERLLKR